MIARNAPRVSPSVDVSIVGLGSFSALGNTDQCYRTRLGFFEDVVPEFARQMRLVERRQEGLFQARQIVNRRSVPIEGNGGQALDDPQIVSLFRQYVDENVGLRGLLPGDAIEGFDPQRVEQWVLKLLTQGGYFEGDQKTQVDRIRIQRFIRLATTFAGALPSGIDLYLEGGFPKDRPPYNNMGRVHLMTLYGLAYALSSMGADWKAVEGAIPPERRAVAGANGLGPGEWLRRGHQDILLGDPLSEVQIDNEIGIAMAFFVGKLLGCRDSNCMQTACETGIANAGWLFDQFLLDRIDLGVLATGESCINPYALASFIKKGALGTNRDAEKLLDHPSSLARPAMQGRTGFPFGEGAGVLFLMRTEKALEIGARIYARLITVRRATGPMVSVNQAVPTDGIKLAFLRALKDAANRLQITEREVLARLTFMHAHGTSTKVGDVNGADNYRRAFEEVGIDPRQLVAMLFLKGGPIMRDVPTARHEGGIGIGHTLGAAGTLALIEAAQILDSGMMPPAVQDLAGIDPEIARMPNFFFPTDAMQVDPDLAEVNAQGFGDVEGSAILKKLRLNQLEGGEQFANSQTEARARADENIRALREGRVRPMDILPPYVIEV